MKNYEHMPHSPTPTYADRKCQQQSVFYISGLEVLIGATNQGGGPDTGYIWLCQEQATLTS